MPQAPILKRRYALAIILYCAAIFVLSAQPKPPQPEFAMKIPSIDKIAHAVIFGGLAGLVAVGLRRSNERLSPVAQFYAPILFTVLYGITDESHQLFVPKRSFDLWDLAADAFGAIVVQLLLCGYLWRSLPHRAER